MKKKLVSLLMALVLCLSFTLPASAAGTSRFTDVPDNAWYAEAVNALADGGVLYGRGNGKFEPNAQVTLAELSVVLMRLRGWGDKIANDAHWAGNAMDSFYLGLEVLDPEGDYKVLYTYATDPAYRGDAVSVLGVFAMYDYQGRFMKEHPDVTGEDLYNTFEEYRNRFDLSSIADRDEYHALGSNWSAVVGSYYEGNGHYFCPDNIDMAYQYGVITGIGENHACNVTGTLTRAELAQMCYNMGWTTADCIVF